MIFSSICYDVFVSNLFPRNFEMYFSPSVITTSLSILARHYTRSRSLDQLTNFTLSSTQVTHSPAKQIPFAPKSKANARSRHALFCNPVECTAAPCSPRNRAATTQAASGFRQPFDKPYRDKPYQKDDHDACCRLLRVCARSRSLAELFEARATRTNPAPTACCNPGDGGSGWLLLLLQTLAS